MAERKKIHKARVGARVGKQPHENLETTLDSTKYRAGGAAMKGKKGGIVRKPTAKVRYKSQRSK